MSEVSRSHVDEDGVSRCLVQVQEVTTRVRRASDHAQHFHIGPKDLVEAERYLVLIANAQIGDSRELPIGKLGFKINKICLENAVRHGYDGRICHEGSPVLHADDHSVGALNDSCYPVIQTDVKILCKSRLSCWLGLMADDGDYYDHCSSSSDLDVYDEMIDCDGEDDKDDGGYLESDPDHDRAEWLERSSSLVITRQSLLAAQREVLEKAMDLLAVREHHARMLLIHYRWDVERIFEMLEMKGREKMFLDAGVTIVENKGEILGCQGQITCGICFEDVSRDAVSVMDCGHYFCNNCWTEHFIVRINEGESRRIRCMASKCKAICDEATVRNLVNIRDHDLAKRFDRFLLESYIDDNNKVKWCPSTPHCGNAIRVDGDLLFEVECTCGLQFCFSCLSEAHSPCSCLMWNFWSKKCSAEAANVNWIVIHTKPCPRCKKAVEKNGGCNLVYCICGQTFCWLCGGATGKEHTWTSIVGHSCNSFKDDPKKKKELAKTNHYRFVHYHDRYKAHMDSLNQESNLKNALLQKITASENKESKIKDYSWALNGMSRLFRSRRVLSYTYPFAFYMFGDELFKDELSDKEREMKKNLFEDQQQQLECNVERLSLVLEKDFQSSTDEHVYETKMRILDLSRTVNFLCMQMYECIENDLLGPLANTTHQIAPYKSNGVEKATEL